MCRVKSLGTTVSAEKFCELPVSFIKFCGSPWQISCYCKTRFFRVPFISRISRAWQVRENNRPRKFEYSSVAV